MRLVECIVGSCRCTHSQALQFLKINNLSDQYCYFSSNSLVWLLLGATCLEFLSYVVDWVIPLASWRGTLQDMQVSANVLLVPPECP